MKAAAILILLLGASAASAGCGAKEDEPAAERGPGGSAGTAQPGAGQSGQGGGLAGQAGAGGGGQGAGAGQGGASTVPPGFPDPCSTAVEGGPAYLGCCDGKACNGQCEPLGECGCFGATCASPYICCSYLQACVAVDVCLSFDPKNTSGKETCPNQGLFPVESCCAGAPCKGWCNKRPDGTESCDCYGIEGGCQGETECCKAKSGCVKKNLCGPLP